MKHLLEQAAIGTGPIDAALFVAASDEQRYGWARIARKSEVAAVSADSVAPPVPCVPSPIPPSALPGKPSQLQLRVGRLVMRAVPNWPEAEIVCSALIGLYRLNQVLPRVSPV